MSMNSEIPEGQWDGIAALPYGSQDMVHVMNLLREQGGQSWNLMLGAAGVVVATKVNLYPFVENMGNAGEHFDKMKHIADWLGAEAMCLVEGGFPTP